MEQLLKIFLLLVDVVSDIVQKVLESKYKAENIQDLNSFLKQKKHELFHLRFNRGITCCLCPLENKAWYRNNNISKTLFDKMFFESFGNKCEKKIEMHSCYYDIRRNFKLTDVDVSLGTSLIVIFFKSSLGQPVEDCIEGIKIIRNEIAHSSDNFPEAKFRGYWDKISKDALYLVASCLSHDQDYKRKIEHKIKDLDKMVFCDQELVNLVERMHNENKEYIIAFSQHLQSMDGSLQSVDGALQLINGKLQSMDGTLQLMGRKLDQFSCVNSIQYIDDSSYESRSSGHSPRRRNSTEREDIAANSSEVIRVMNDDDQKYYQLFNEIEQLRLNGKNDQRDAWKYLILCYITLRGSSEEDMDKKVLENMGNCIFGSPVTPPADTEVSLLELTPKFVEIFESTYMAASVSVAKAVVFSYGGVSPNHLSELCTADILYEFVLPDCIETDEVHLIVNLDSLVKHLLEKLNNNPACIGKYLSKIQAMQGGTSCLRCFVNALDKSRMQLSSEQMISFLSGLTKDGKDFNVFEEEKTVMDALVRPVDEFENTVIHHLVVRFSESDKFKSYLEYFFEKNISMRPNSDNLTPLYFAAYLGQYGILSWILPNVQDLDCQLMDILQCVEEGIGLLQIENPTEKVSNKVHIEIQQANVGSKTDFDNILDILGAGHLHQDIETDESVENQSTSQVVLDGHENSDVSNVETAEMSSTGPTEPDSKDDSDISKVVGDKVISFVKELRKVLADIPDLVNTIDQATKPEED